MRVINLQSWAGNDFSCLPGELVELSDDVAKARIEAGLALPGEPQAELFAEANGNDSTGEIPQCDGAPKARRRK